MTYSEAIDEIFGIANTAWQASAAEIVGTEDAPIVRWPGNAIPDSPPNDAFWAMASYQGVTDDVSSLAAPNTTKIYDAVGLFFFQIFCPKTFPDSLTNGRLLAEVIQAAFRTQSPSGETWFTRQVIKEPIINPDNYQINVVITCNYSAVQ